MMPRPRILLCDDHGLILDGLRSLLAKDFEIIGVAANGRELVSEAERLKPAAILLDITMPVLNGIEAARQIKAKSPAIKLLFVTQRADREYVRAAFRLGASGYILKQSLAKELVHALCEVLSNRYYVAPQLCAGIDELLNPARNPSELFGEALTARQREVLQLIAEGKSNKEVAGILNISVKTVDFHKAGIVEELGLRTTAELTRYAIEHGMVDSTPTA